MTLGFLIFLPHIDICDPGWSYFNSFCYAVSKKCANWTEALANCRQKNASLVNVYSKEENVFIQRLRNGAKSWLGLNDISREGTFTWAGSRAGNFTVWAKNQPNNVGDEDCAHTLGIGHNYKWNDVKCSDCHQYTCKKGQWKLYKQRRSLSISRLYNPCELSPV